MAVSEIRAQLTSEVNMPKGGLEPGIIPHTSINTYVCKYICRYKNIFYIFYEMCMKLFHKKKAEKSRKKNQLIYLGICSFIPSAGIRHMVSCMLGKYGCYIY